MRIPTSKIYRAFAELDGFTDAQCERLMQRVRLDAAGQSWLVFGTVGAACVGAMVGTAAGLWLTPRLPIPPHDDELYMFPFAILCTVLPGALALATRDVLLRRFLVKAITLRIDRVRCPGCRYILIGQRAEGDRVGCPECGRRASLRELGITEADLVPPTATRDVDLV